MPSEDARRWRRTSTPDARDHGRYDDIWFVSDRVGWGVNGAGQIIKTIDGAATWSVQKSLPGAYLRCIAFADDKVGWVGTTAGSHRLYHTVDGGATWTEVLNLPAGAPSKICGLWVVDQNTVYACGSNLPEEPTVVIKTADGGATWSAKDMKEQATSLIDLYFRDALNGWVVGGLDSVQCPGRTPGKYDLVPVVLRTRDGGETWVSKLRYPDSDPSKQLFSVYPRGEWGWKIQEIVENDTLVVSLQNYRDGAVLWSDDGGETWLRRPINDRQRNANLEGIGFLDTRRGWVGGWGDLPKVGGFTSATEDGGTTWNNDNDVLFRVNRFRFLGVPAKTAYAAGAFVYKFDAVSDEVTPAALYERSAAADDGARTTSLASDSRDAKISVRVFAPDTGELIRTLVDGTEHAGEVAWDFRDSAGAPVPPGIYFLRTTTAGISRVEEVVVREVIKAAVGFAADIRPLFRNSDRNAMIPNGIDLFDYEQVKFRATDILSRLEDGSMPCDRAWPAEWVGRFKTWIADGMQP